MEEVCHWSWKLELGCESLKTREISSLLFQFLLTVKM